MVLRQLEYLAALAREKHFGRAADACHVSQPTLSAAIRLLEDDLGAPIVERGHRYVGLTAQGQVALEHAQRVLAEVENLRRSLEEIDKGLTGRLRIGVVPTALPIVSQITGPFFARFPGVTVAVVDAGPAAILFTPSSVAETTSGVANEMSTTIVCQPSTPIPDHDTSFDGVAVPDAPFTWPP